MTTTDKVLHSLSGSGGDTPITTLANAAFTPLLASDNRSYLGNTNKQILALNSLGTASWTYTAAANATVAPTMDCQGHLYVAANDTIYALITDAQGLANSPWPKFQRDSRNTGNADKPTVFGVRNGPTCVQ